MHAGTVHAATRAARSAPPPCGYWAGQRAAEVESQSITLTASGERPVQVTLTYPQGGCADCTLIAFSHGAYAAPSRYERLLRLWGEAGFVVAAPLHVDSELNPTRDQYDPDATMLARLEDFAMISGPPLRAALAGTAITLKDDIIAAGHSYGALIAQAAAGAGLQTVEVMPADFLAIGDSILGVVAISPPGPMEDYVEAEDWARVTLPMLVVTGTTDVLPGFMDDWRLHLASFEAARLAPAFALVYAGQDHNFNGAYCRPTPTLSPQDTAALQSLGALSVGFMHDLVDGQLPDRAAWLSLSGPMVEARVSATLEGRPMHGGTD